MKSIFGFDQNLAAAFSYFLGPITGILVLVLEKNNKFVRFHALQSTLWFLLLMVVGWVLSLVIALVGIIPLLGGIVSGGISTIQWLIYISSKIILVVLAFSGSKAKIPIIGLVAWNQVNK